MRKIAEIIVFDNDKNVKAICHLSVEFALSLSRHGRVWGKCCFKLLLRMMVITSELVSEQLARRRNGRFTSNAS
jgi:hypothetical protein